MLHSDYVKDCAKKIGFEACGLAPAQPVDVQRAETWRQWLQNGFHGEMSYLANYVDKRLNPQLLVEGAKTVVCLAVNYYPGPFWEKGKDTKNTDEDGEKEWRLARYAYGTDYHEVVKSMLRKLMSLLQLEEGKDGRIFVDTAPIDEKYWAEQCGLGWRGKNTQLILPHAGSYFFLGELVLTHEADIYDHPIRNRCGQCRACIDACPTRAITERGEMDARRCLSYLTIEYKGEISDETARNMPPCFYGCDRCAEVCPWNKRFARRTNIEQLQPRESLLQMNRTGWKNLTREQYTELFRKSAVKRAKIDGLIRNIKATERGQELLKQSVKDVRTAQKKGETPTETSL